MSELQDFNQRVIREFRANQGKVSGQLANMPVLLLTMTGARSGRTITKPLVTNGVSRLQTKQRYW
jgi:hypothetical protein